jgi:L-amino acid N-acyltransferase YncA
MVGREKPVKTLTIDGRTIEIRAFERGDVVAVGTFAAALPAHDLLFLSRDIQHARVIEAWQQAIADGEIDSLIAVDGDDVAATSAIVRDPLSWSPHVAEIRLLVAPVMRGHGLGRLLLEQSIRIASERGAIKLIARMTPDQRGSITLFEEAGFRGEAMLRDHVRDRDGNVFDLAILSLDLRRASSLQASWGLDAE